MSAKTQPNKSANQSNLTFGRYSRALRPIAGSTSNTSLFITCGVETILPCLPTGLQ
jgi:hypothetical protein